MLEPKYYGDPSEFDHQYRNKTRSESYENLLSETWQLPRGSKILDIASGVGDEAEFLKENYSATVFQTDISPNLSNLVRLESNFVFADFNNQPFRSESFDGVHCKDALVHVKSKNRFLNEAYRVLKPGGSFFFGKSGKF